MTREASVTRRTLPGGRSRSSISCLARAPVRLKKYFTMGSSEELRMTWGVVESKTKAWPASMAWV